MSLSIEQMRAFIADQYPSNRWKERVAKMSDGQVYAIYIRINLEGNKNKQGERNV